jgi:2-polyprenyl-3-methyl-5-hydroxy-6-metoxy-1,4-benzoquinol methylase
MSDFNPDNWDLHWKQNQNSASLNPAQVYRHQLVARIVEGLKPASLVDLGCGQGDFLQYLDTRNSNIELRGLELSHTGTEITKSKVSRAVVVQADVLSSGFSPNILPESSIGTCIEVLEHLDDALQFLKRAKELIAQDGLLIITVPSGPRTAFDVHIGHRRHFDKKSLTQLLHESGFSNISVERYGWPFFNLYRTLVLIRGKKLIQDVESDSVTDSVLTKFLAKFFSVFFKMNIRSRYVGWQLVATCTVS